jgi:hypothetical protein
MTPFGDPADSESPVALRPRLATGVLFRGGGPDETVRPRVSVGESKRTLRGRHEPSGNWFAGPPTEGLGLTVRDYATGVQSAPLPMLRGQCGGAAAHLR